MEYPRGWARPEEKESHPGKTLKKHINEIYEYFHKLLKLYKMDILREKYPKEFRIIEDVIKYHDMGKLHPEWNFDSPGIYHSVESVYWILKNKEFFR